MCFYFRLPTRNYSSCIKDALCRKPIPVPSSAKIQKFNPLWTLVGSTGYIGCRYLLNGGNVAHCEHREPEQISDNHFDWNKLLSYLSPDLFNLLAAIIVRSLINIRLTMLYYVCRKLISLQNIVYKCFFYECNYFQAAFVVALCNLNIPINLQHVINTVLQFARDGVPFNYEALTKPLSKLLALYLTQVILR